MPSYLIAFRPSQKNFKVGGGGQNGELDRTPNLLDPALPKV